MQRFYISVLEEEFIVDSNNDPIESTIKYSKKVYTLVAQPMENMVDVAHSFIKVLNNTGIHYMQNDHVRIEHSLGAVGSY